MTNTNSVTAYEITMNNLHIYPIIVGAAFWWVTPFVNNESDGKTQEKMNIVY